MKNKKIMIIIGLLIVLSISLSLTMALYKSSKSGQAQLSVASPKIRLVNETTHIEELDLRHYSNNFKVVSYDENGKNSEVGLKYNLKLEITDEDAPIDMKLFKINSNGTETEVELNRNLETKSTYNFEAGKKQEDEYRLEMWFNLENTKMDDNTDIKVNLNSVQVEPEK